MGSVSELSETIASVTLAMRMLVCSVPTNSTMSLRQETVALWTSAMRARTCCPLDTLRPYLGHHGFHLNLLSEVVSTMGTHASPSRCLRHNIFQKCECAHEMGEPLAIVTAHGQKQQYDGTRVL